MKLSSLSGRINAAVYNAQEAFRKLLRLHSSPSPDVLRMYASFLIDVASDEKQGKYLLRRAEEIEEMRTRETTGAQCNLFEIGFSLLYTAAD